MRQVKENDRVTVRYEGRLENGEVFESSSDAASMTFRIGEKMIMPALEQALLGMTAGQTRTVAIPPEDGYGPVFEELVLTIKRGDFEQQELAPGMVLALNLERDGQTHRLPAMVTAIEDGQVTVDFNHPLAGKELFYTVTVTAIEPEEG